MEKFLLEMEMEKDMNMEHGWNNYGIIMWFIILPCVSFYFLPFGAFWSLLEIFGMDMEHGWNSYGIIMWFIILHCVSFYFCLLEPFGAFWSLLETFGDLWSFFAQKDTIFKTPLQIGVRVCLPKCSKTLECRCQQLI